MSASSEKRRRQSDREQGVDKRSLAQREAEEKAKKTDRNWKIGGILIVLFVVVVLLVNAFMYHIPAVKVGNETYSAAEMRYYYTEKYAQEYQSAYYQLLMSGEQVDGNFVDQPCPELEETGGTWGDYIEQQVFVRLEESQAVYEQAKAAGYSISEDGKATVKSQMESLQTTADNNDVSLSRLLKSYYGEGVTSKVIEKMLTRDVTISEYQQVVMDGFEYSDEELDTYFAEHIDKYRTYNYLYYFIKADVQEPEEEEETPVEGEDDTTTPVDEQDTTEPVEGEDAEGGETTEPEIDPAVQEAIITANGMAAYVTDEESFREAVNAYVEGDEPQLASNVAANQVHSSWITEEAHEYGETVVASSEDGAYVLMFISSDEQDYNEISVRHILVMTEDTDEDGSYSEEELAAAKKKAEDLLAEWEAGDKTEESFAAMANEYSEDPGSNTKGGLYENVYKGAYGQEFNDFCFAEGRKPGDTGIVHGSGGYDGYHVMYFVGEGPLHSRNLARQELAAEDYEEWEAGIVEGVTHTLKFGMKLVIAE